MRGGRAHNFEVVHVGVAVGLRVERLVPPGARARLAGHLTLAGVFTHAHTRTPTHINAARHINDADWHGLLISHSRVSQHTTPAQRQSLRTDAEGHVLPVYMLADCTQPTREPDRIDLPIDFAGFQEPPPCLVEIHSSSKYTPVVLGNRTWIDPLCTPCLSSARWLCQQSSCAHIIMSAVNRLIATG